MSHLTDRRIVWEHTGDAELPYTAEVEGRRFTIRLNDFPAEPLYTVLAEGVELQDLEDWPSVWVMPSPPKELLDLLRPKVAPRRSPDIPRTKLHLLARILEVRGVTGVMRPLLRAVEVAGESMHFMTVSALARRVTLLVPYRPEVLAELAPGVPFEAPPRRPLLDVLVDGDRLDLGLVSVGDVPPREAVEVATGPARAAWAAAIAPLFAIAEPRVVSRSRSLTRTRASIDVLHAARAADDEDRFVAMVDDVASRVGLSVALRDRWRSAHASLGGAEAAVVVTTACGANGPSAELTFTYGKFDWDEAVRLCTLLAGDEAARGGAAVLGVLAATLQPGVMSSVKITFGAEGVDVAALIRVT